MINTFTLHFPIENILQSQSSLKWWIHSLFISQSKTFSRVPNLLWNEVFSETRGGLELFVRPAFDFPDRLEFFCLGTGSRLASHLVCLNTFTLHFPNENVLRSTQSSLKWSLLWTEVFSEVKSSFRIDLNFFRLRTRTQSRPPWPQSQLQS